MTQLDYISYLRGTFYFYTFVQGPPPAQLFSLKIETTLLKVSVPRVVRKFPRVLKSESF